MPLLLPLALIAVPLIEIALFVVVGGRIGLFATIAVVIVTAVAGAALLRRQGLAAIEEARRAAEAGHMPIGSVIDGLFLFAAGLLLLTPGFLTDAIGFLLFVRPLRRALAAWIWRRLVASGSVHVYAARSGPSPDAPRQRPGGAPVIEGDYVEIEETEAGDINDDEDGADRRRRGGG